jgi:hypothetical protein
MSTTDSAVIQGVTRMQQAMALFWSWCLLWRAGVSFCVVVVAVGRASSPRRSRKSSPAAAAALLVRILVLLLFGLLEGPVVVLFVGV